MWISLEDSICFQGSVELDSHSQSGLEQLPIVSKTATHKAYYCRECDQVKLIELQSGMMSQHCAEKCCQKLTSFLEDSPAKTSVLQDLEKAWRESEAGFSSRLLDWSKSSHPNSSFWKTSQPSELEGEKPWLKLWPRSGMTVGGQLLRPQALEPFTKETDGSYLPTPTATPYGTNKGGASGRVGKERLSLQTMARRNLWPTPTARDWKDSPGQKDRGDRDDSKLAMRVFRENNSGQLNPQWVEWLMGYRIGWTELSALEIQWFHSKSKKRSKN